MVYDTKSEAFSIQTINLTKRLAKKKHRSFFGFLRKEQSKNKQKENNNVTVALNKVNIKTCPGELLGLLGPNGSGKTTIYVCYQKRNDVWYGAAVQDNQVLATCFSLEEPDLERLLARLPEDVPFQVVEEPNQLLAKVLSALAEVFNGKDLETYGFKIDMTRLSSYTRKVLNCTRLVPVGYVTTYGAVAKVAGGIARSVGRVEATNPFPLLIPCHRVVRSDLSIGGYGYGEQVKLEILQGEDRGYEESIELQVDDKKLSLFPAKWIKQKDKQV